MELLFTIIVLVVGFKVLVALITKRECDICEVRFTSRMKRHSGRINGKKRTICAKCYRKLDNQVRAQKFDEFFDGSSRQEQRATQGRKPISSKIKREVWQRDEGRCVQCGSNENLEYDHIIPVSKGGANTFRNLQLLCQKCNRSKSAKIQ